MGDKKKRPRVGSFRKSGSSLGSRDPDTPIPSCHGQPEPDKFPGDQKSQQAALSVSASGSSSGLPGAMDPSSQIWAEVLEIAKKKLSDNNLPPLDLKNLTSQSAEDNVEAIITALNTAQKDDRERRRSYTWRGRKVIVLERLGKTLKRMEKYSKVVDIAVQSNPQVSALIWAGVWAILRVRIQTLSSSINYLIIL